MKVSMCTAKFIVIITADSGGNSKRDFISQIIAVSPGRREDPRVIRADAG